MSNEDSHHAPRWSARAKLAFLVFAGIGAYFLIAEHRAHVLPYLPWLFLLACPLMHLFHGHGGHGSHRARTTVEYGGTGSATTDARGAPAHHHP